MKKISCLILLLLSVISFSQITANDDAVYLDSLFNIGNKKNYKYIQVVKDFKILKETYQMGVYFKSGKVMMKGATLTSIKINKTGPFFYFYENGKRKSIINYENNKAVGAYYEYHENGEKKLEGVLIDKKENVIPNVQIKNAWNEKGIQTIYDGTGFFEECYYGGSLNYWDFGVGKIVNNLKDRIWNGYNKKTKISYKENYKNGELLEGVSIDSTNVSHHYKVLELKPVPKKGMNDFLQFLGKNFQIPDIAKPDPIKGMNDFYKHADSNFLFSDMPKEVGGKIILKFVVNKDGKIVDSEIIKGLDYIHDSEAIRVLLEYGDWIPGEIRGIKVRGTFSLPISIQSP